MTNFIKFVIIVHMKVSEKLNLIQKISKLTQEQLAKKIGVSFVALNSWINKNSQPRKKNQDLIDELYRIYTGQKIIEKNVLDAKKNIINAKKRKHKNIIATILKRNDLYQQFVLSLTYHTNSIEGSTLDENETADILFENATLPRKTLVEHLEVKNHQAALQYIFQNIRPNFRISENFILQLHQIMMNGIISNAGNYRQHGVRIVGANIPTANYLKIPELMPQLIKKINQKNVDTISLIAETHSCFEQVHPFSDGNGRVGRLLVDAMLLRDNLPPAIIKRQNKRLYYTYLNKSQKSREHSLLEDFLCDSILEAYEIIGKS